MARERRHGFLAGSIVIDDGRSRHDLHDHIWTGPYDNGPVIIFKTDAKFILLVEKHNIFTRLVGNHFHKNNGCVLACGGGYPGNSFRRLLSQLHDQLQLPFYVLADNDPAGYLLFFLIARGAAGRLSTPKKTLAISEASFLGVRTGDSLQFGLGDSVQIKLRESEIQELCHLKRRSWLQSNAQWQLEIDELLKRGSKLEMEAFSSRSFSFLSDSYLPERLAAQDALHM